MSDALDFKSLEVRIAKLESIVFATKKPYVQPYEAGLDWSLNERAFVARYATGMTGAEKLVLLIAFLTKGDTGMPIALSNIEGLWNKMTAKTLLGMKFNRKYTTDAKTAGWINSPATGQYQLTFGWYEIYEKQTKKEGE